MTTKKHFLNTAFGSYLKVLITTILTLYLAMGVSIFDMDLASIKILVGSAISSSLPILINALNPNDPRYGKSKETEIVDKE